MQQVYMSNDGKVFYTEEECSSYETKLILGKSFDTIKDALNKIETVCANRRAFAKEHGTYCSNGCPFSAKLKPRTLTSDCLFAVEPSNWHIEDFFSDIEDIECFQVEADTSTLNGDDLQDKPCGKRGLCDYCENRMTCHLADE
jgi:hypothetical protein